MMSKQVRNGIRGKYQKGDYMMAKSLKEARELWKINDDKIRLKVRLVLAGTGMTQEQFGKILGMTSVTLRSRLKQPGKFTQEEMRIIDYYAEKCGIPLQAV